MTSGSVAVSSEVFPTSTWVLARPVSLPMRRMFSRWRPRGDSALATLDAAASEVDKPPTRRLSEEADVSRL